MHSTITNQTDVFIWLESNGICLYVNDDETPSVSISFEELTDEFLEVVCIDGKADGETVNLDATVKEHKLYNETKQTVLTRAKVVI